MKITFTFGDGTEATWFWTGPTGRLNDKEGNGLDDEGLVRVFHQYLEAEKRLGKG